MPGISDLLDSDMESNNNFIDENSLISSVSDITSVMQSKTAAIKKPRKRKCVTMPKKARAKTAVNSEDESKPRTAGAKRKAKDDEVAGEDDLVEAQPAKPRGRNTKNTKTKDGARATTATESTKTKAAKKEKTQEQVGDEEAIPSPVAVRSDFAPTKTTKAVPKPVTTVRPKTSATRVTKAASRAVEVVSDVEVEEEEEDAIEQQPPRKRARTESRLRQEPTYRRRAGSASDTERGDPMLRRKLGDITRKYENVDMKYRHLKDVAVSEANANVEKLRKQCEAITEASNKLVTSLRKELAMQAPMLQEARKSKKDAQTSDAEVDKLRTANKDLSNTLSAARNEIKALQTKLAAARATPAPAEVKPPPTASKAVAPVRPPMTNGSGGESDKIAQLKIDLYGDLTGLIIRGVKQAEDGDTYDCIQTGRNGTLHFKLFVDQENAKTASFEDTEFLYTPLLDANRDRDLIEMMPDYLAEDITFERQVAPKFYARVVKTLTERPAVEEEE